MKKHLLIPILLLLSIGAHSQQGGIKIEPKFGEPIFTNYVMFSNGYGWNEDPYVQINDKKGEKIPMTQIDHVEGFDQKRDFRYILPLRPPNGSYVWGERLEHTDRVNIYYTDFSSTSWSQSVMYKSRNFYYTFDNTHLNKMNYKNLKAHIGNMELPSQDLKKANGVRIAQIIMYTAGAAMIVYGSSKFLDVKEPGELGDPESASLNLHPTIFVGAALVNIPYFLNSTKQKHMRAALMKVK